MTPTWQLRYIEAKRRYDELKFPVFYAAQGSIKPILPKVKTANGLTSLIVKFLTWSGHRATRISTTGRLIDTPVKQQSGVSLITKKWIHGTTRKGTADVSSTIKVNGIGRSVQWEIKSGKDTPSEWQLREQITEREAGGEYFFVHNPEEFFALYDQLFLP